MLKYPTPPLVFMTWCFGIRTPTQFTVKESDCLPSMCCLEERFVTPMLVSCCSICVGYQRRFGLMAQCLETEGALGVLFIRLSALRCKPCFISKTLISTFNFGSSQEATPLNYCPHYMSNPPQALYLVILAVLV
jgi:hypothetical protein